MLVNSTPEASPTSTTIRFSTSSPVGNALVARTEYLEHMTDLNLSHRLANLRAHLRPQSLHLQGDDEANRYRVVNAEDPLDPPVFGGDEGVSLDEVEQAYLP